MDICCICRIVAVAQGSGFVRQFRMRQSPVRQCECDKSALTELFLPGLDIIAPFRAYMDSIFVA